jgi:thiamine pyrophosphate-dependent acetolactate synthase large subunit-like protein
MLRDQRAAAVVGPYRAVHAHPGAADLAELRRLLAAAERPIMLVGGSGWSDAATADIARFATANGLPVCCSFRRQDIVDNRLPCFVGDLGTGAAPSLVARFKAADLVLAVGARIGEITSQSYTLLGVPDPGKTLIHVHAGAEELGRVFRPDLAIQSGMPEFAAAVAALDPVAAPRWRAWRAEARAEYEQGSSRRRCNRRRRSISAGSWAGCASACPTTRSSPATPAISAAGRTAFCNTAGPAASSARPAARWAMACRRRSPPSSCIPTGWSSASAATAVS